MTEILFYHLTESKLEDALPGLLDRSVERGWHVVVQTVNEERRDQLDQHLWLYRDDSFLAHGTPDMAFAEEQPILITTDGDNVNSATVRFMVDGAEPPGVATYERVVFMFDGYDTTQLDNARANWKRLKSEGHTLTYWQQNDDGRWVKKA